MKILLLGATGQVGWELLRTLTVLGELVATSRTGADGTLPLDVSDLDALRMALDAVAPEVIVNACAYTAVDTAEAEPQAAQRLNAELPEAIGTWAAEHRALVIHYSTDYVFDGYKKSPYVETDQTGPVSVYGQTKLAGDQALLASGCSLLILRVSWVYGLRGQNFLLTMRRLMAERDSLRIVDDQIGAPTWCRTIAQATSAALARLPRDQLAQHGLSGVYHLQPAGSTSWFGFTEVIRERLRLNCTLQPIPSSEYPTPARRPINSCLDSTQLETTFGLALPTWEHELRLCLDGL